ncbi:hypothetical protein RIF29_18918 [Crotalaria pallida]|uniref:Cytochrome P450 n=1 Tax=Crotalaria pallida TaxID=3830 RepID=A0AAN9IAX7_CROPI
MELGLGRLWMNTITMLAVSIFVFIVIIRRLNGWYYALKLRRKNQYSVPPGDMGWPFVGNLVPFMRAFLYGNPDTFINNLVFKYGRTGIYKTHLFGNPSIIVCEPYMCRKVLTDDEHFGLGYPKAVTNLMPSLFINTNEHKRFRRLIFPPIIGHKALAMYVERIEDNVIRSLEEMSSLKHPIEFLKEMKNVTFKVIIDIFLGPENQYIVNKIGGLVNELLDGFFCLPVDLPGSVYHKALKAREKLRSILQPIVEERRMIMNSGLREGKKDLADILLEIKDENGKKLENENIVDLLLAFLAAGHDTTATALTWIVIYLTDHPEIMKKAKDEQEEILRTRQPSQKQIDIKEIKQMVYLAKVIDETLRLTNVSFSAFRKAMTDVDINGYIIPKGWRVLIWQRAVHMDPANFQNPQEFNPSRWDDYNGKAGSFSPFGAGSRLCVGMDLAKLEISIFMQYFLNNYKLERLNPNCGITSLPIPKPVDGCLAKVIRIYQ